MRYVYNPSFFMPKLWWWKVSNNSRMLMAVQSSGQFYSEMFEKHKINI